MKEFETFIGRLIIRLLISLGAPIRMAAKIKNAIIGLVMGFIIILVAGAALFVISYFFKATTLARIAFFLIVAGGMIKFIGRTHLGTAILLFFVMLVSLCSLLFPGRFSTLVSNKLNFDNNGFYSFNQAEDIRNNIQDDYKNEAKTINDSVSNLMKDGKRDEAFKLWARYFGSGEDLKYKFDSVMSRTKQFKQTETKSFRDNSNNAGGEINKTYVPPQVASDVNQQVKKNRQQTTTPVTFKAGKPSKTNIKVEVGDAVLYKNVKGTFKIKGSSTKISEDEDHHAIVKGPIEPIGITDGYVEITVIPDPKKN